MRGIDSDDLVRYDGTGLARSFDLRVVLVDFILVDVDRQNIDVKFANDVNNLAQHRCCILPRPWTYFIYDLRQKYRLRVHDNDGLREFDKSRLEFVIQSFKAFGKQRGKSIDEPSLIIRAFRFQCLGKHIWIILWRRHSDRLAKSDLAAIFNPIQFTAIANEYLGLHPWCIESDGIRTDIPIDGVVNLKFNILSAFQQPIRIIKEPPVECILPCHELHDRNQCADNVRLARRIRAKYRGNGHATNSCFFDKWNTLHFLIIIRSLALCKGKVNVQFTDWTKIFC